MVLACATAVLATFLITESITRPAAKLLALTNEIADGNLAVADVDYKSKDEIGRLTEAMNRMKADLRELVRSVRESVGIVRSSAEQMASGAQETSASVEEFP
jgi:methyl-accepting chemotaxis protein